MCNGMFICVCVGVYIDFIYRWCAYVCVCVRERHTWRVHINIYVSASVYTNTSYNLL